MYDFTQWEKSVLKVQTLQILSCDCVIASLFDSHKKYGSVMNHNALLLLSFTFTSKKSHKALETKKGEKSFKNHDEYIFLSDKT